MVLQEFATDPLLWAISIITLTVVRYARAGEQARLEPWEIRAASWCKGHLLALALATVSLIFTRGLYPTSAPSTPAHRVPNKQTNKQTNKRTNEQTNKRLADPLVPLHAVALAVTPAPLSPCPPQTSGMARCSTCCSIGASAPSKYKIAPQKRALPT